MQEEARYKYRLNSNSVVLDIGAYQGTFAVGIFNRYKPIIHCFEPIAKYYQELRTNTARTTVILHHYGIGARTESVPIHIAGDASSVVIRSSEPCEIIQIKSISDVWAELKLDIVDLVKINIEGMEYELLDCIIVNNFHMRMKNIQVQFHQIPEYEIRLAAIRTALQKTHHQTYCWHMLWENWELNHE